MRHLVIVALLVALSCSFVSCNQFGSKEDELKKTEEIAAKAAALIVEQQKKDAEEKAKLEQQVQEEVQKQIAEKEAEEKAEADAKAKEKAAAGKTEKPAVSTQQRYYDRCMRSHAPKDHAYCDCFASHAAQNLKQGASKEDEKRAIGLAALACVLRK